MQSLPGAIFVISLVLFPYVYGLALVAFSSLSQNHLEMSKLHGLSELQYFRKIALPLALPAISAGCLLTMMEAFADFGTVEYMGVTTFATGIFRTWFGMNEPVVAAQLSATLVCFVLFILFLEQWSRRKQRFFQSRISKPVIKRKPTRFKRYLLCACVITLFAIAFVLPLIQILYWSYLVLQSGPDFGRLSSLMWNSFSVAGLAALVVLAIALIYGYAVRISKHWVINGAVQISSVGYAFPGAVIAVGAVIALGFADRNLNQLSRELFDVRIGLFFSGTLFALIFAYTVRYLTVGLQYVRNGLNHISPSLDHAAKSLGHSSFSVLAKVHLPLLRNSVFVGLLMVFVDVLKELPATLILRPFNFDTLAVRTYELASDERLTDASLPALLIVLVGLVPVWFIQKNVKA
jgi:iron(III) transport system permease protein